MKARRIFASKTVIFIWSIFAALFFFTTQISIFNITSRVDEKKVPFKAQKSIAAKIQAQIFFKGKRRSFILKVVMSISVAVTYFLFYLLSIWM